MKNQNQKGIVSSLAIIIIIAIGIIAIGGVLAYQYLWAPEEKIEEEKEVPKDETAGWKTYRNTEYGFEFKYPEEWKIIDEENPENPSVLWFVSLNCGELCELTEEEGPEKLPERADSVKIIVWDSSTSESEIIDYLTAAGYIMAGEPRERNDTSINGEPAVELFYHVGNVIVDCLEYVKLYIVNTENYVYTIEIDYCSDDECLGCDQILSTFKFID